MRFQGRLLSVALLLGAALPARAQEVPAANTYVPPAAGDVAPPFQHVIWRRPVNGPHPRMADLRGQVVLVHTWVWFCDS